MHLLFLLENSNSFGHFWSYLAPDMRCRRFSVSGLALLEAVGRDQIDRHRAQRASCLDAIRQFQFPECPDLHGRVKCGRPDRRSRMGRSRAAKEPTPRHGDVPPSAQWPQRLALPAVLAGGIAIGFSPIFVRLSELGPIATGFYRLFLALPLLWLWMRWEGRRAAHSLSLPRKRGREREGVEWLSIAMPGILFAGDILFWHWSITYTTVANATLLANLAPVIVTLGAWFYLREQITVRFILGMALAMGGAALLVNASAALGAGHVLGDILGLITACFFGSYVVVVARLRDRIAASTIMFYSSAVTCVLLLAATLVSGESLLPRSQNGWMALLALAWISQAMGQGLIAHALGHLPASFSALAILIEPLTAAILGWVWLGEQLGVLQATGGVIVLAGITVARRASGPIDSQGQS
jgi:drug/metabolite transporter (DMT)-like permease